MFARAITNQDALIKELMRVMVGVILLFACSQMSIPLEPVPISLQTVGLMVIAVLYDMRSGMSTILTYIGLGVMGLPIFADYSSGVGVLMRSTSGYLLGFILCIYVMNTMKAFLNMNTARGIFLNCLIGTLAVFICGIAWLSYLIGFEQAIIHGLLPFIMPGLIKAVMLTAFLRSLSAVRRI
ncbi:MAG: biotin transporter BioY [Proteobacteria bacterium]|nr:biotin transporter BioY [Pseudomonadota bacterium]